MRRARESPEDIWLRKPPSDEVFEFRELDDGVAYMAMRSFDVDDVVEGFRAALPRLADAPAIVIDVRGNRGGNTGRAMEIAAHFTRDTLPGERWRSLEHVAVYKAWGRRNPEYEAYWNHDAWTGGQHGSVVPAEPYLRVPVAVLIDEGTRSAAEGFLVFMDQIPGVTLLGCPSNGSTGQPLIVSLSGGGFASIVSKRNSYADGKEFVGVGVQPDIIVETTIEDVRAGRDPVLEQAQALLRSSAPSSVRS
ncbi:MAG: S41 family peptidase [Longimicrobiales bacterium]